MNARFAFGAVVTFMVSTLAGCVEFRRPDADFIVHIPDLKHGDRFVDVHYASQGSGDAGVRTRRAFMTSETSVAEQTERIPDRFGIPTSAVAVQETQRGGGGGGDPFYTRLRWIETDGGRWLMTEGRGEPRSWKCYYSNGVGGSGIAEGTETTPHRFHNIEPAPHGLGQVWGKTFSLGETIVESGVFVSEWYKVAVTAKFVPERRVQIHSPAFPEEDYLTAMVVRQTLRYEYRLGPDNIDAVETEEHQIFVAEGVPAPLRVQVPADAAGDNRGEIQRELLSYTPGAVLVPFGDQTVTAQFGDGYPGIVRRTIQMAPPLGDVANQFPVQAAIDALALDPRAAAITAWRLEHPEAFLGRGVFLRGIESGVYRWQLTFRDDRSSITASVRRDVVAPGLSIDTVESIPTGPVTLHDSLKPAEVRSRPMVDASTALMVAKVFSPESAQWKRFEWAVQRGQPLGEVSSHWVLRYSFQAGNERASAGPAPFTERHITAFPSGLQVDGYSGDILPQTWFTSACTAVLFVRPPY